MLRLRSNTWADTSWLVLAYILWLEREKDAGITGLQGMTSRLQTISEPHPRPRQQLLTNYPDLYNVNLSPPPPLLRSRKCRRIDLFWSFNHRCLICFWLFKWTFVLKMRMIIMFVNDQLYPKPELFSYFIAYWQHWFSVFRHLYIVSLCNRNLGFNPLVFYTNFKVILLYLLCYEACHLHIYSQS